MLATLKYLSWHPPRLSDHNSTLGRHAHAHLRKQIPISRISSPRTVWDRRIVEASSAMSVMGQKRRFDNRPVTFAVGTRVTSRPPPLAPPTPQPVARLCSSASQLLWRGQTSHDRTSSATAPRLPDADQCSTHAGAGRP